MPLSTFRESHVKRAAQLPPPNSGGITAHLPLDMMPEWLTLHGVEILDITMEFGGPLIIKGRRANPEKQNGETL